MHKQNIYNVIVFLKQLVVHVCCEFFWFVEFGFLFCFDGSEANITGVVSMIELLWLLFMSGATLKTFETLYLQGLMKHCVSQTPVLLVYQYLISSFFVVLWFVVLYIFFVWLGYKINFTVGFLQNREHLNPRRTVSCSLYNQTSYNAALFSI